MLRAVTCPGSDGIERRLAAILCVDAVGYSRLMAEGERIYGDGVNIAARLEGLAEPGGICISGAAHEQVESELDPGVSLRKVRQQNPTTDPDFLARWLDGLRKTGLPEE